jgi:tRNA(Arg) A34 adenosine deaminase TadA
MKTALFIVFAFFALTEVTLARPPHAGPPSPARRTHYYPWRSVKHVDVNGVYPGCRVYWLWHAQERQFAVQNSTCPFGPFAADIVDHTIEDPSNVHIDGRDCGKWLEGNSGERGAPFNPILHAEVEAIYRLMNCTLHPELCNENGIQLFAQNKPWWANLTMYSTGESCELDAAGEAWAGIGELIFGINNQLQRRYGWPLPGVDSFEVFIRSGTPTVPHTIIADVDIDEFVPYYSWQYVHANPCPVGCKRNPAGDFCIKA